MTGTLATTLLAIALLAFVGIASSVLLWDGLAAGAGADAGGGRLRARPRGEVIVGAIGFAIVLWIALGLVKHAF